MRIQQIRNVVVAILGIALVPSNSVGGPKLLRTLKRHGSGVSQVRFSPDGKRLGSAGATDPTVILWSVTTGKYIASFPGISQTTNVDFSPDSKTLAFVRGDKIELREADKGKTIRSIKIKRTHKELYIVLVRFSRDGKTIAMVDNDKVSLWRIDNGSKAVILNGHKRIVSSINFSPDGKSILTASYDKTARVWDRKTGMLKFAVTGHEDLVYCAAFSPDGKTFATCSGDGTVKLWHSCTGKLIASSKKHRSEVWSLAFSPDGKRIASAGDGNTVRVLEARALTEITSFDGKSDEISSVEFSPNGKLLATASGKTIRLWDLSSLTKQAK